MTTPEYKNAIEYNNGQTFANSLILRVSNFGVLTMVGIDVKFKIRY